MKKKQGFRFAQVPKRRSYRVPPEMPQRALADYLLTLDFPKKRVRLERGELPAADGAQVLDFESRDGVPFMDVSVGKLRAKALIDSGALRATDFPASLISKLPLASYPRMIGKGSSVTGESSSPNRPVRWWHSSLRRRCPRGRGG